MKCRDVRRKHGLPQSCYTIKIGVQLGVKWFEPAYRSWTAHDGRIFGTYTLNALLLCRSLAGMGASTIRDNIST
jgi:hypothetical protein